MAVPWLRRLITSLSPHTAVLISRPDMSAYQIYVVQSCAVTGFIRVLRLSDVNINLSMLHTHLSITDGVRYFINWQRLCGEQYKPHLSQ